MSSEEEDEVIVSPIGQSMANRWGFMLGDINDQADLLVLSKTGAFLSSITGYVGAAASDLDSLSLTAAEVAGGAIFQFREITTGSLETYQAVSSEAATVSPTLIQAANWVTGTTPYAFERVAAAFGEGSQWNGIDLLNTEGSVETPEGVGGGVFTVKGGKPHLDVGAGSLPIMHTGANVSRFRNNFYFDLDASGVETHYIEIGRIPVTEAQASIGYRHLLTMDILTNLVLPDVTLGTFNLLIYPSIGSMADSNKYSAIMLGNGGSEYGVDRRTLVAAMEVQDVGGSNFLGVAGATVGFTESARFVSLTSNNSEVEANSGDLLSIATPKAFAASATAFDIIIELKIQVTANTPSSKPNLIHGIIDVERNLQS